LVLPSRWTRPYSELFGWDIDSDNEVSWYA
jgi:hypothetical protein